MKTEKETKKSKLKKLILLKNELNLYINNVILFFFSNIKTNI